LQKRDTARWASPYPEMSSLFPCCVHLASFLPFSDLVNEIASFFRAVYCSSESSSFVPPPASFRRPDNLPRVSALFAISTSESTHAEHPKLRFDPPTGSLNLSVAYSADASTSLFHLATASRVPVSVQGLLFPRSCMYLIDTCSSPMLLDSSRWPVAQPPLDETSTSRLSAPRDRVLNVTGISRNVGRSPPRVLVSSRTSLLRPRPPFPVTHPLMTLLLGPWLAPGESLAFSVFSASEVSQDTSALTIPARDFRAFH